MSNDIRSILERMALVEGQTTPVSPRGSMNQQQQRVPQLPALFKPRDISPTLTKKPYQAHPMDGYMVGETALSGADDLRAKLKALQDIQMDPRTEQDPELKQAVIRRRADLEKEAKAKGLSEAMQEVEEDMISKVKGRFADYLETLEKKNKIDQHLIRKAKAELNIDDDPQTEEDATWDADVAPISGPADAEDTETAHGIEDHVAQAMSQPTAPVGENLTDTDQGMEILGKAVVGPARVYEMTDGTCLECWGDDTQGYELRRGDRKLPTRFPRLDHADMAMRLFQKRREAAQQDQNQDYIEER